jgi:uncharacterized protein YbjT (DUF2867 family)
VILLTGATGYVGGRLLRVLEKRDLRVRCLARRPEFLAARLGSGSEVVRGDLLAPETLPAAFADVHAAYYLVHSMGESGGFEAKDRLAAENFGREARAAGVGRIIYLGGLGDDREDLSAHLRSRHEVGNALRASGVPVIELRASIVIGSGSLSFEMIRALVEHLPVLITPRWVANVAQPIGISDLLEYLVRALEVDATGNPIFEIGGADQVSYGQMMREYARQRGLRRFMIPVPVLTPRLSSLWLGLVTPLYARVGRKLIDSIRHPTVVRDTRARDVFGLPVQSMSEAVASALRNEDRELAETRWSDALSASGGVPSGFGGQRFGARLVDSRELHVRASAARAFEPVRRLGGANGWYAWQSLWRLRGAIDLLFGGVGLRRGRAHPRDLRVGDTLDFWRVEAFEPDRLLRLAAEMKAPGRAWLEFEVTPEGDGARIRQTAIFDPVGLAGLAYWYAIYPLHALVFGGLLAAIGARAVSAPPMTR